MDVAKDSRPSEASRPHWVATTDADTFLAAAVAGLGLIQVPCNAPVRTLLSTGKLDRVLAPWATQPLKMTVLYARNRPLTERVRVFVDWVTGVFAKEVAAAHSELQSDRCPRELSSSKSRCNKA